MDVITVQMHHFVFHVIQAIYFQIIFVWGSAQLLYHFIMEVLA